MTEFFFAQNKTIFLQHTDAAGVLFFANQLALVHEVYEAWLASAGLSVRHVLDAGVHAFPIVKAETELLAPIRVGDDVRISLSLTRLGESSLTIAHAVHLHEALVGRGTTVHVWIERETERSARLPEALVAALSSSIPERF